jgi:hypothetical protein
VSGTASLTVTTAALLEISVTPFSAGEPIGVPIQYRASAIYSDGTTVDVTGGATWTSSNTGVATISDAPGSKGRAMTVGNGTTTIKAHWSGIDGTATLTVTSAKLTKIQITPFSPTVPVGFGIPLTAIAIYDDGTTINVTGLATWVSSAATIAAVSDAGGSKGRLTPVSAGSATISATWNGITGTDVATVSSATLSSIAITPSPLTIPVSGQQQLTATGTFSDGSTLDITVYVGWTSGDPTVADVSDAPLTKGIVYGFTPGSVVITATRGTVKGTSTVSVK